MRNAISLLAGTSSLFAIAILALLLPRQALARCNSADVSRCIIIEDAARLPGPPNPFYQEGLRLFEAQDDKRAAIFFRKALETTPGDARPHLAFAMILEKEGKVEQALHAYSAALAIDDAIPAALSRRAELLVLLGQEDKALIDLSRLLEIEPDRHSARNMRAEIYLGQKQFEKAALDYAAIAEGNDLDPRWRLGSARAYIMAGDEQAALAQLDIVLEAFPNQGDALVLRGGILLAKGDKQGAARDLEKVLANANSGDTLSAEARKLLEQAQ